MNIRYTSCAVAAVCWFILLVERSPAVSLSTLFDNGSITADDKLLNNFRLVDLQTVNGGFANTSQIDVTPLIDDPLNPGIRYTADFGALGTPSGHTGPSSVHFVFSFDVSTTNQLPLIKDNSLLIVQWSFDSGPLASIQVSEQVFDAAGAPLGTKLATVTPQTQNLSDSLQFTPRNLIHVTTSIDIAGPNDNDMARLLVFEQRFSQIPEPGSLTLLGAASAVLLAGSAWRRRS
jgi:PEP-CTERM motif